MIDKRNGPLHIKQPQKERGKVKSSIRGKCNLFIHLLLCLGVENLVWKLIFTKNQIFSDGISSSLGQWKRKLQQASIYISTSSLIVFSYTQHSKSIKIKPSFFYFLIKVMKQIQMRIS